MEPRARTPALDPPGPPAPSRPSQAPEPAARRRERDPGWRSLDILRTAALVIGLYLILQLLWVAHQLLFITFLGVLFGLAVSWVTDHLERARIPRAIGAALIVLGVVGILYGLGAWSAPTLRQQFSELRQDLPAALNRIEGWLESQRGSVLGGMLPSELVGGGAEPAPGTAAAPGPPARQPAGREAGPSGQAPARGGRSEPSAQEAPASDGGALSGIPKTLSGQLGAITGYLFSFLSSTVAVLGGILLILFTAIYVAAEPRLYRKGLLHLFPHRARPRAEEVLSAIGMTLRRWLVTQLVAMVVIGVLTTVVLKLLGVRAALSLGIIAGLLEFIPIIGPILAAVPAVAIGFLDSPQTALFVALAYIAIQQVENQLLIPLLMREGVDLPPLVTLIGITLMGIVFGFLGMLVAVPLLAAIFVAVKLLYVEGVVGDDVKTVLDSE